MLNYKQIGYNIAERHANHLEGGFSKQMQEDSIETALQLKNIVDYQTILNIHKIPKKIIVNGSIHLLYQKLPQLLQQNEHSSELILVLIHLFPAFRKLKLLFSDFTIYSELINLYNSKKYPTILIYFKLIIRSTEDVAIYSIISESIFNWNDLLDPILIDPILQILICLVENGNLYLESELLEDICLNTMLGEEKFEERKTLLLYPNFYKLLYFSISRSNRRESIELSPKFAKMRELAQSSTKSQIYWILILMFQPAFIDEILICLDELISAQINNNRYHYILYEIFKTLIQVEMEDEQRCYLSHTLLNYIKYTNNNFQKKIVMFIIKQNRTEYLETLIEELIVIAEEELNEKYKQDEKIEEADTSKE